MAYSIAIDARKLRDFGIGTYIRNLVHHLAEIDQENRYVLFVRPQGGHWRPRQRGPRERGRVRDPGRIKPDGIVRDRFDSLPGNFQCLVEHSPVYSIRELVALSWRLFRLKLDLYHSTHYVLPAVVPCRAVVTIHDIIHVLHPDFLPNRLALLYAQRMIRRSLSRGDQIISVSNNTKADLLDNFDVEGQKIQVVHNGVEDLFRRRLTPEEVQRRLGELEIQQPYLLFVGNPKPHKNLDNVVQAYARAHKLHSFDAPLVCVGARDKSDFKVRQRAEQLGIADRVHLLGHVDQAALPAIYQGATLFLYPALYEGFGLPVVEAMASGVAVITSNTSALKEVAAGYAQLVSPLDVEEMARAIARLMADDEYRQTLAEKGRRRAEDFHWHKTAEKTLEIYHRTLKSSPQ